MTEECYPECTCSIIKSLSIFRKHYPHYRMQEIEFVPPIQCIRTNYILCDSSETIKRAVKFLHDAQQPEGAWFGSWGICFSYATRFALESLSLVGETYENSEVSRRACDYLVGKQRADGGWGESYKAWCGAPLYAYRFLSLL
jgi:lanosterol synthase